MDFFKKIVQPILFRLPEEAAHEFALRSLRLSLSSHAVRKIAARKFDCDEFGDLNRFGFRFRNPLGIAAGFDKNGIVVPQLAALGFGFVEVGTVTFHPQEGNPKPRLFRLPKDRALINRAGFNNEGARIVSEHLRKIRRDCVVGVNIGKSRIVPIEEATQDYLKSFEIVFELADFVVVNVSSPNTPGLRELQSRENLEALLGELQKRNLDLSSTFRRRSDLQEPAEAETQSVKPLLVKIAPDLTETETESIVGICLEKNVAGIIATNTTISRDGLRTNAGEISEIGEGGLSGAPLQKRSNEVIEKVFRFAKGRLPIIGVGGIFNGEEAFEKIALGASLLQAYTGFVYEGPGFAHKVNQRLSEILRERGFASLDEAVGSSVKI